VPNEDAENAWESQAEVDVVLSETGATMNKLPRWRREGLLPREIVGARITITGAPYAIQRGPVGRFER
jgi:hypothetical protein